MKHLKRFLIVFAIMFLIPGMAFAAAETLTTTRGTSTFPVAGAGDAGMVKACYGTYEIGAAVEDGDIFEMCRIPANSTILMGWMYGDDIDTGTEALDMDIGWAGNGAEAADPDGLGDIGTITGDAITDLKAAASIFYPLQGTLFTAGPLTFTRETVLQIEANTASNAGHTGTLTLVVLYSMD